MSRTVLDSDRDHLANERVPNGIATAESLTVGDEQGLRIDASAPHATHARDPERKTSLLTPVLDMGRDTVKVGLALGILIALIPHAYASVSAETSLLDMLHWVQETRGPIHDYFWTSYDIDIPKVEPKKEDVVDPPPPPPPPPPAAPPPKMEDPYKDAPPPQAPAPAKADDIYNAKDNAQEPLSFPGTMVDNDGSRGAGFGQQANDGKGTKPVTSTATRHDGAEDGKGTGAAPSPAAQAPDRSKPPTLVGSTAWNCPFPAEADAEGVDSAMATIIVKVRPDGSPESVSVVSDPGSGFGRAARSCALTRRYSAGLDRDGNPTTASTPPIRVRFSR